VYGRKLAIMNGWQNLVQGFIPLPGGASAVDTPGVLPAYYRHGDWLGSSRLATNPTQTQPATVYSDGAYAPFGESYSGSGATDLNFTGQNQDSASGLYDFLYRKYSPAQGRWISPDPAGLAAANPSSPQSWNRYAYVGNRPLNSIDPLGLDEISPLLPGDGFGGGGGGGCDPFFDLFCGGFDPCDFDPLCGLPIGDPGGGGGGFGGGGGVPSGSPQRHGGVWPDNETLGLPRGLNIRPLGLGDLFGLAPNLGCGDFVQCGSLGPFGNSFIPALAGAAGGTIVCQIAEPCGILEDIALLVLGTAATIVYFARGQQGDVGHDYVRDE